MGVEKVKLVKSWINQCHTVVLARNDKSVKCLKGPDEVQVHNYKEGMGHSTANRSLIWHHLTPTKCCCHLAQLLGHMRT